MGNLTSSDWWEEIRGKISDERRESDPKLYGAELSFLEDGGTANFSVLSPAGRTLLRGGFKTI